MSGSTSTSPTLRSLAAIVVSACSSSTPTTPKPVATFTLPGLIDSHVHLVFSPVADKLAASGITTAVDLAAPERAIAAPMPLRVLEAGPMITRPEGYPLDSWGRDGYGIGCADAACVTATIDRLAGEHVALIKLALDDHGLADDLVPGAVVAAHAHHLKVAVHALSNAGALRGATAGADVLAHTPVEPLADATVAAWRGRAVISTLAAFGGSEAAVTNLAKLRAANVTVLYGTDLGNLDVAGPSAAEIALLGRAGLDGAAIVDAMTTAPAKFWGLAPDPTTFTTFDRDPRVDPSVLAAPRAVTLHGRSMR